MKTLVKINVILLGLYAAWQKFTDICRTSMSAHAHSFGSFGRVGIKLLPTLRPALATGPRGQRPQLNTRSLWLQWQLLLNASTCHATCQGGMIAMRVECAKVTLKTFHPEANTTSLRSRYFMPDLTGLPSCKRQPSPCLCSSAMPVFGTTFATTLPLFPTASAPKIIQQPRRGCMPGFYYLLNTRGPDPTMAAMITITESCILIFAGTIR